MHTIEQLEILIPKYSRAYYLGKQMISDAEFDSLVEELKNLDPSNPILSSVGWGGLDNGFSHRFKSFHIGSLVTGISEKPRYPSKVKGTYKYVTPKVDGGSICLYYKNHVPFAMITRGNGKEGINVLHKFLDRIPSRISYGGLICFRGEAYTPKSKFSELKEKGVPNPRNTANGILNRDSGKEDPDLQYVDLVFYQIRIFDGKFTSKEEVINSISGYGLPTVPCYPIRNCNTNPDTLKEYYKEFQELDYPIDGIVLTGGISYTKESYFHNVSEDSIAYKFESESSETMVTKVEWTTGSSGRVNPVVHFNSVFLSGANIQKATGFNAKFIIDNSIGSGALIKITRSNEVIPYIQETINPSENTSLIPNSCPVCGSKLEFDGVTLYCRNKECPSRNIESCVRLLELVDIPLGLGGKGGVNINDIVNYACSNEPSLKKMIKFIINYTGGLDTVLSPHYCELAESHLENLKSYFDNSISISDFWYILNLPSVAKITADKLPNPSIVIKDRDVKTTPALRKTIVENLGIIEDFYDTLTLENIKIFDNSKNIISNEDLIPVCYTGKTDKYKTRKEFYVENRDRVKESSINSAKYLICNEPSSSSKYKYAKSHGIPIMTEKDFMSTILS